LLFGKLRSSVLREYPPQILDRRFVELALSGEGSVEKVNQVRSTGEGGNRQARNTHKCR